MSEEERRREWTIPAHGGRLGWPAFKLEATRKQRGNAKTWSLVIVEAFDYDGYEGMHLSMPPAQAERLLALLPEAIAFARGRLDPQKGKR